MLPPGTVAVIDRGSWRPPPVFGVLAAAGGVTRDEMERVFNMGVGMVAVVAAEAADQAVGLLTGRGVPAWLAGEVTRGPQPRGSARLTGSTPAESAGSALDAAAGPSGCERWPAGAAGEA